MAAIGQLKPNPLPPLYLLPRHSTLDFPPWQEDLEMLLKLAQMTSSVSQCSCIKSVFLFSSSLTCLVKSNAFNIGNTELKYFSLKSPGIVRTLNLSCKTIESTSCMRQFLPLKSWNCKSAICFLCPDSHRPLWLNVFVFVFWIIAVLLLCIEIKPDIFFNPKGCLEILKIRRLFFPNVKAVETFYLLFIH